MGTAYNLPTLDGMRQVIKAVTRDNVLKNERLIIAGYGTKERLSQIDDSRIDLRGELTDAELDDILSSTKGCIVYQDSGCGALTKIPELLIAGVPVIINSHAARSHHNLPGIFEFETLEQLGQQMEVSAKNNQFPQVLCPPDASSLLKRIGELVNYAV